MLVYIRKLQDFCLVESLIQENGKSFVLQAHWYKKLAHLARKVHMCANTLFLEALLFEKDSYHHVTILVILAVK